jgi:hypothetical protein
MKNRKIYRYTGDAPLVIIGMPVIRPGQFISRQTFDMLPKRDTIEQTIGYPR